MPSLAEATLDRAERRMLARLIEALQLQVGDRLDSVWLYGSRARGEWPRPDSDVDLLVITAEAADGDLDLVLDLVRETADAEGLSPFAFSVQVFDRAWLHGRRAIDSFYIQEVDRDRIVLFGLP